MLCLKHDLNPRPVDRKYNTLPVVPQSRKQATKNDGKIRRAITEHICLVVYTEML